MKIFRFEASLYFANKEHFFSKLFSKVELDPRKMKLAILKVEKKQKKENERVEKLLKKAAKEEHVSIMRCTEEQSSQYLHINIMSRRPMPSVGQIGLLSHC